MHLFSCTRDLREEKYRFCFPRTKRCSNSMCLAHKFSHDLEIFNCRSLQRVTREREKKRERNNNNQRILSWLSRRTIAPRIIYHNFITIIIARHTSVESVLDDTLDRETGRVFRYGACWFAENEISNTHRMWHIVDQLDSGFPLLTAWRCAFSPPSFPAPYFSRTTHWSCYYNVRNLSAEWYLFLKIRGYAAIVDCPRW